MAPVWPAGRARSAALDVRGRHDTSFAASGGGRHDPAPPLGCRPRRGWQWEEARLQADGTDVAAGFRFGPTPATTILDPGSDAGNSQGVAISVQGQEVVLPSDGSSREALRLSEASVTRARERAGFASLAAPGP
jgi:hypothetical protein